MLTGIFWALVLGALLVAIALIPDQRPRQRELPRTVTAEERKKAWQRRKAQYMAKRAQSAADAMAEAHARTAALRSEFHNTCTAFTRQANS